MVELDRDVVLILHCMAAIISHNAHTMHAQVRCCSNSMGKVSYRVIKYSFIGSFILHVFSNVLRKKMEMHKARIDIVARGGQEGVGIGFQDMVHTTHNLELNNFNNIWFNHFCKYQYYGHTRRY